MNRDAAKRSNATLSWGSRHCVALVMSIVFLLIALYLLFFTEAVNEVAKIVGVVVSLLASLASLPLTLHIGNLFSKTTVIDTPADSFNKECVTNSANAPDSSVTSLHISGFAFDKVGGNVYIGCPPPNTGVGEKVAPDSLISQSASLEHTDYDEHND